MSRARPSRNRAIRSLVKDAKKLPTARDFARYRYDVGLLVDADLDYLDGRWLKEGPARLAAVARPFRRLRQAGIKIPDPTTAVGLLGFVLSFGPEEHPPAHLVEAIAEIARRRPKSQQDIEDRRMVVACCRLMGGPTGLALRQALAEGEHQVWPSGLGGEPAVCPLDCSGSKPPSACVCAGGSVRPGDGSADSVPSMEVQVRTGDRAPAKSPDSGAAADKRGHSRSLATDGTDVETTASPTVEAVPPGLTKPSTMNVEPVPVPYSEPGSGAPTRRPASQRQQTINPAHRRLRDPSRESA